MEAKYLDEQGINAASREGRRNDQTALGASRKRTTHSYRPTLRDRLRVPEGRENRKRRASIHLVDARRLPHMQAGGGHPVLHPMGHSGGVQDRSRVRGLCDSISGRLGQRRQRYGRLQEAVQPASRADLVGYKGTLRLPRQASPERAACPQATKPQPQAPHRETRGTYASADRGDDEQGRLGCRPVYRRRRIGRGRDSLGSTILRRRDQREVCTRRATENSRGKRQQE